MGSAGGPPSGAFLKSRYAARAVLSSLFCAERRMEAVPAVLCSHMVSAGHWQKPQQAGVAANNPHRLLGPLTLFALSLGILWNAWSSGMTNSAALCKSQLTPPCSPQLSSPVLFFSRLQLSSLPFPISCPLLCQNSSFLESSAL